jgi:hypothetical protein
VRWLGAKSYSPPIPRLISSPSAHSVRSENGSSCSSTPWCCTLMEVLQEPISFFGVFTNRITSVMIDEYHTHGRRYVDVTNLLYWHHPTFAFPHASTMKSRLYTCVDHQTPFLVER